MIPKDIMSNISSANHSEYSYVPLYPCYCSLRVAFPDTSTPISMTINIIVAVFLIISGSIINVKLYKDLQAENSAARGKSSKGNILYSILTTYSIVQIVVQPPMLLCKTIMECGFLDSTWISFWPCHIYRSVGIMLQAYLSCHSLASAMTRYFFIIHESKVRNFGAEKTKKLLHYAAVLFPVGLVILLGAVEAPLANYYNPKYRQCVESKYSVHNTTDLHLPSGAYCFALYNYLIAVFPGWLIDGANIILEVFFIVALTNIMEMFLYHTMFKNLKR